MAWWPSEKKNSNDTRGTSDPRRRGCYYCTYLGRDRCEKYGHTLPTHSGEALLREGLNCSGFVDVKRR
jgi:hypothetical protein